MPADSGRDRTPRQNVELECARRGGEQVVAGCVALLRGQQADDNLILALGGLNGEIVLNDGPRQRTSTGGGSGARGLLYAWPGGPGEAGQAEDAVIAALADEHWRVREMASKVIAGRRIGAALGSWPGCATIRCRACGRQPSGPSSS